MTAKSQTVEDIVKEVKAKWEYSPVDKTLEVNRQKEFFEKAGMKLDPIIYAGEFRPYRPDSQSYESGNQVLDRMAKKGDDVKGWIAEQLEEAQRKQPPKSSGYNFKRDTASYSGSFEDVAKKYLSGEARELYAHLKGQGREFYDITRIGTANLEGAVAALAIQGNEAALLGSKDFDRKVSGLAANYGISKERAISYVMAHEFVHASQKGRYTDHISAELDVEHTLKGYFTAKGQHNLASIASDRAGKVMQNYGGVGKYAGYSGKSAGYSGKAAA